MKILTIFNTLVLCLLAILSLQAKRVPRIFDNLSSVEQYAAKLDEYPDPDNDDLENPDFSSYLQTRVPSWLSRQLESNIGLRMGGWSASGFKELIEVVTNMRENAGYHGRFFQTMKPHAGMRFLILGELHGAFHSFLQDLRDWVKKGFINEKFKILQPDLFIVINGGVASRSPYILETLTLIARLLYVNPERVIFDRGVHEDKERWKHYGLKKELKIRAEHIDPEKIPLAKLMNRFFGTLPLALYLIDGKTDKVLNVVRISNYGRDAKELSEKNFSAILEGETCAICPIEKRTSDITIDVRAIIRGEQFLKQANIAQGLVQYGKEEGATSWFLLSAPTGTYRALLQFFYDTYVILTIYESLDDWTMALYSQDVRERLGFKRVKVVKLVSGIELPDEAVEENKVKVLQQKLQETVKEIDQIRKDLSTLEEEKTPMPKKESAKPEQQIKSEEKPAESTKKSPLMPTAEKTVVEAPASPPVDVKEQPVAPKSVTSEPIIQKPAMSEKPAVLAQPAELAKKGKPSEEIKTGASTEKWAVSETGKIVIGGIFDLSRTNQENSRRYINGVELAFYEANKNGGIKGREIELQTKDDESDPDKAYERVKEIQSLYKTDLIMGPIGWNVMGKIMNLIMDGEIVSLFPVVTSGYIRRPRVKYVLNYMLGVYQEFTAVARYLIEKVNPRKPAVVYFSDFPDAEMEKMCHDAGLKNFIKITHAATDADFTKQIQIIDNEKPDALILFTFPLPAMSLMRQMKERINSMVVAANSGSVGEFFDSFVRHKAKMYIVGRAVPNPASTNINVEIPDKNATGGKRKIELTIINDFKSVMAARKEEGALFEAPDDPIRFMGYICGRLLVAILRQVNGVITKEKILDAAATMLDFSLAGLPLSYDLLRHQFSDYVWLDVGTENWIPYFVGDVEFPPNFLTPEEEKIKKQVEEEHRQKK